MDAFWFFAIKGLAAVWPFWCWANKVILVKNIQARIASLKNEINEAEETCRELMRLPTMLASSRIELERSNELESLQAQIADLSELLEVELYWTSRKHEIARSLDELRARRQEAQSAVAEARYLGPDMLVNRAVSKLISEAAQNRNCIAELERRLLALRE